MKNRNQQGRKQQKTRRLPLVPALVLLTVLSVFWGVGYWLAGAETFPMHVVEIKGEMEQLQHSELEAAIAPHVSGGFFSIDLARVRSAALALPWVDDASIQRIWPDRLVVTVHERVPVARWGKDGLVTADGVVFYPSPSSNRPSGLPVIVANDDMAVDMTSTFLQEAKRFSSMNLHLQELHVSERGSWKMVFRNGLQVIIGSRDVTQRLQRLATYIEYLKRFRGMPESIDLRYQHGMAVMWKPVVEMLGKKPGGTV